MITVAVGAEDLRLRFVLLQGKENDEFLTAVLAGIFKARHMHLPGILRKGSIVWKWGLSCLSRAGAVLLMLSQPGLL